MTKVKGFVYRQRILYCGKKVVSSYMRKTRKFRGGRKRGYNYRRYRRRLRRFRYFWAFGKGTTKVGKGKVVTKGKKKVKVKGPTFRKRILKKKVNGKWKPTSKWYWRRWVKKSKKTKKRLSRRRARRYQWRWGKKTKKVMGNTYKKRVLYAKKGGKWNPAEPSRSYWRRVPSKNAAKCRWQWGKKLKKKSNGRKYRLRVYLCFNKKTKKTKQVRSYWRPIRSYKRRRYQSKYVWRWGLKSRKSKRGVLKRERILFKRSGKKWIRRRSYFRSCTKKCVADLKKAQAARKAKLAKLAKLAKAKALAAAKAKKSKKIVKKGKKVVTKKVSGKKKGKGR